MIDENEDKRKMSGVPINDFSLRRRVRFSEAVHFRPIPAIGRGRPTPAEKAKHRFGFNLAWALSAESAFGRDNAFAR